MRIDIEKIVVSYGHRVILNQLSAVLLSGESIALVGPSGSGKTTLLAAIALELRPLSGRVRHREYSGVGRVSWVLQTANVLPRRTALDNAMLGAYGHDCDEHQARAKAETALASVGLSHLAAAEARSMSGGERQRIVVARTLTSNPDLIVADEPTAQLDRANADRVIASLIDNQAERTTVVVATHDEVVAERCQRVLRLVDGQIT